MTWTTEAVERLHDDLSNDLDGIKKRFKAGVRVTLVVRVPGEPDQGTVIGDDDLEEAVGQIRHLQAKAGYVIEPESGSKGELGIRVKRTRYATSATARKMRRILADGTEYKMGR